MADHVSQIEALLGRHYPAGVYAQQQGDFAGECQCGHLFFGQSGQEARLAWAAHVARASDEVPAHAPDRVEGLDEGELRVRIQRALLATLGGAYDCTRVWSAWSYGTMDEDDFVPVLDRLEELINEIAAALSAPTASSQEQGASGEVAK